MSRHKITTSRRVGEVSSKYAFQPELFERDLEQHAAESEAIWQEFRTWMIERIVISEYYDRTEKAAIDILETQEPVDQTIILWWGLDGLRLNEDGTMEWVSRRKPKPVRGNVFYQPCKSMQNANMYCFDQSQSIRATQMEQMSQQINQPIAQMTAQIDQQINSLRAQNSGLERQMIQNLRAAAVISLLPMPGYMGYRPQY